MRVVSIDTANAPQVLLTVIPPPSLQGTALPHDAFEVREAGVRRPAEVDRIDPATVEVVAVLELSGADAHSMRDVKGAAVQFLLGLPDRVRFSVVDTTEVPLAASTTDIATAIATIDDMEPAPGGDLASAVTAAALGFTRAPGMAQHVVIFSASSESIGDQAVSELSEALRRESAVGHVVGWSTIDRARGLAGVADATGGSVELVDGATPLSDAGARMAAAIANQYRLAFVSSATGSTDVVLEVRHLDVEARTSVALSLPAPQSVSTVAEAAESPAESAADPEPTTTRSEPPTTTTRSEPPTTAAPSEPPTTAAPSEPPTTAAPSRPETAEDAEAAETAEDAEAAETAEGSAEGRPAQSPRRETGLSRNFVIVMAAVVLVLIGAMIAGFIATLRGDSPAPDGAEDWTDDQGGQT